MMFLRLSLFQLLPLLLASLVFNAHALPHLSRSFPSEVAPLAARDDATSLTSAYCPYTEAWLNGVDGHHFYTRTYSAFSPKAILVFVHGFDDDIERYTNVHAKFASRGVTVFTYDMRGFGKTALDTARRSSNEQYAKTNRPAELGDLEYWVNYVSSKYPRVPLFVMGHSAGGGLVSAFAALSGPPPKPSTVAKLSGVIAQAPLIRLTHPPSADNLTMIASLSVQAPDTTIPAPMPAEWFTRSVTEQQALENDPYRQEVATARGLHDMITQGQELLDTGYKRWSSKVPLLMTWGTDDQVNDAPSGIAFFNKLPIWDKQLVQYQGARHDLLHESLNVPQQAIDQYIAFIESHLR